MIAPSRGWDDPNRPGLLSIENPDETKMDVGKNSWAVYRVRAAFDYAYHSLHHALRFGTKNGSCLLALLRLDTVLRNRRSHLNECL